MICESKGGEALILPTTKSDFEEKLYPNVHLAEYVAILEGKVLRLCFMKFDSCAFC